MGFSYQGVGFESINGALDLIFKFRFAKLPASLDAALDPQAASQCLVVTALRQHPSSSRRALA